TGLAADAVAESRLRATAEELRAGFLARGFAAGDVVLLGVEAPARREAILRALASTAGDDGELWLVLLGTSVPGRNGAPAFQIPGPRLTSADLVTALRGLEGRKRVVIATSQSGGFVPALAGLPQLEVVAATAENGELSEPRYGEAFAAALRARPADDFAALAAEAARRVAAFYSTNQLAQTEHATGWDAAAHRAVRLLASSTEGTSPVASAPRAMADRVAQPIAETRPPAMPEDAVTRLPANDESRRLLAEARDAAADSEYAAVVLEAEDTVDLTANGQARVLRRSRTFVRTGEALDRVASLQLPSDPPQVVPQFRRARIIRPDAGQVVFEPALKPLPDGADPRLVQLLRGMIELPEVEAGCVVEVEYVLELRTSGEACGFYREWMLGSEFPTKRQVLRCTLPVVEGWRWFAPNLPAPQEEQIGAGRRLTWTVLDLPALEAEAASAPARTWAPWVGVSGIASWDALAKWYRLIAADAMTAGPKTTELGRSLAAQHPARMELLRAAYERVAALRYVAIELGVGGFRPRTPDEVLGHRYGDCKDKANLLVALLRVAGIEAEFALVNRGETTFQEFPGMQFNHALVHVPAAPERGQAHELWLDATDRLALFGSVPTGDYGRAAFIVGTAGEPQFRTITNAFEEPVRWSETWELDPAQPGRARVVLNGQGGADEWLRRLFAGLSPAERRARMRALLGGAPRGCTIETVAAPDAYDLATSFSVTAEVRTGGALPAPCPPSLDDAFAAPERHQPLVLWEGRPWRYVQTVRGVEASGTAHAAAERSAGGFTFARLAQGAERTTEVRWSGGELPAAQYAAARAAYLEFLVTPSSP
ncbi:MAG TPA: transglutaminase domain-containing protein, partial [Opitutaceae bacterium]|nr:transglutaminase domain-containing protein [Opitutaceae bacterium]